ncbi:EAL domain-containing protein [Rheinheimera sp.]|uniref:EAL domain-containing protein n=1 Tax=Rheinheimera sp. TaxID=1869214 RepID=UPI0037CC4276
MHLSTIAEGVENEAQELAVKAMGCDEVQGFMYAKPMPQAELLKYLQQASA